MTPLTKSAKPDFISGNEQRLSWSFKKCFHILIIDLFRFRVFFHLPNLFNFLMVFLANLVFCTWWWFTDAAHTPKYVLVLTICKKGLMIGSILCHLPCFDKSTFLTHFVEHCVKTSGPFASV